MRDKFIDTLVDSLVANAVKHKTVQGVTPVLLQFELERYVLGHTVRGVYFGLPVYKVMYDTVMQEYRERNPHTRPKL